MSDDLISRRNVLRKIGEWSNKLSCENSKQFTLAEFELMIANEETSYDIEKTVYLINKNSEKMQEVLSETLEKELVCVVQKLFRTYTNSLVEIVKSGGGSDD